MAIDPKLLVIKPVSEIETSNNPLDGEALIYDGGQELKKASLQSIKDEVVSGIKGEAVPTTVPTPWTSGDPDLYEKYDVKTAGNYTNFKDISNTSIVVTSGDLVGNLVQFWVTNGVSQKVLTEIPNTGLTEINKPYFEISDINDETALRIYGNGETDIAKFHDDTIERIKDALGSSSDIDSIDVLGDSISTDNGGDGSQGLVQSDIWCYKVAQSLGSTIYVNAVAGSCIATGGGARIDMSDDSRLNAIIASNSKVVFIFGGINDFGQDIPLGNFGSTDKTNFHGALRYIYTTLMTGLPNSRIIHITPLHMNYAAYTTTKPEYNGQNYLTDYIDAIKQEAQAYGVSVIDTNRNSGITQYNINSYSNDGIHGNAEFHNLIKNCVIRELKNLV